MKGLQTIRKERHMTQSSVADALHITREALSYYENGKRSPDITMLIKMSDFFGVSIHFLITGEEFK